MLDQTTNSSRGLAFITMASSIEAQKAIAGLNGKPLDGRNLIVSIAVDQASK